MTARSFKPGPMRDIYDVCRNLYGGFKVCPKSVGLQGQCGNAYWRGRTYPKMRCPALRGSLAYAAWAAGIDDARKWERANDAA